MANNCLITQLKASVANSKLLKLDEFPIEIIKVDSSYATENNSKVQIVHRFNAKMKTVSDGGAIAATFAGLTTDPQTSLTDGLFYVKNDDFIVKVSSKNEIEKIILANGNGTKPLSRVNINNLKYINTYFIYIAAKNGAAYGDISNLPYTTKEAYLNYCNEIYGCLETLCENFLSQGRASGTLKINIPANVEFHNEKIGAEKSYIITFGSNSCTITSGGSTIASYDGTTWTYNS